MLVVQAVLVVALVIVAFIAGPAVIARRIESRRHRAALEAVSAYRENPTQEFFAPARSTVLPAAEPTATLAPPPRIEDPILAALRRREELVKGNLDRIFAEFIEGLGWKGAQAARALLVGSGELPLAVLGA